MSAIDTALPGQLRETWGRIAELDDQLDKALQAGDYENLERLASERYRHIVSFFDAFPIEVETAELRLSLLEHLINSNNQFVSGGRTQLKEVSGSSATARHNKRAVFAYHAQGKPQ